MALVMSECDECKKKLKKGDAFALLGEYPGFAQKIFFGAAGGLDQFSGCYLLCEKCFKQKFQKRK